MNVSREPKIISKLNPINEWEAIDDNTYDGEGSPVGYGRTEQEAVDDLKEQLTERGLYAALT